MSSVKKKNNLRKNKILSILKNKGPQSKVNLAKITNLSIPSVTKLVNILKKKEIIVELGEGESSGGRRPLLFDVNSNYFYFIGIYINVTFFEIVLVNINLEVIDTYLGEIKDKNIEFNFLSNQIVSEIQNIINKNKIDNKHIRAVGISLTGIVDSGTGRLKMSLNFPHWQDIPVVEIFHKKLNIDIFIENDARILALGESIINYGNKHKNLISINITNGVGIGILVNNELIVGSNYCAGEFGHISLDKNGPICRCGNRGCIETFVSEDILISKVKEMYKSDNVKHPYFNNGIDINNIDIKSIVKAAINGNKGVYKIIDEMGQYLGQGISILLNLFNPEIVVIDCHTELKQEFLLETIKRTVRLHTLSLTIKDTKIEFSKFSDYNKSISATTLAYKNVFSNGNDYSAIE